MLLDHRTHVLPPTVYHTNSEVRYWWLRSLGFTSMLAASFGAEFDHEGGVNLMGCLGGNELIIQESGLLHTEKTLGLSCTCCKYGFGTFTLQVSPIPKKAGRFQRAPRFFTRSENRHELVVSSGCTYPPQLTVLGLVKDILARHAQRLHLPLGQLDL